MMSRNGRTMSIAGAVTVALVAVLLTPSEASAGNGTTTRVSVASDGTQGIGRSEEAAISADGRHVAFSSQVSTFVAGDTNSSRDVFVHDRQSGSTTLVSKGNDGSVGNALSELPDISGNGRYVAFRSDASNLVPGDTNNRSDMFVHDLQSGTTTLVSKASDGTISNSWSYNRPAISADGVYVAFESTGSNLVAGDTNGTSSDIFVHNRQTGATTLASVSSSPAPRQALLGANRPAISADGRYVAFESADTNLAPDTNPGTDVFVHDRQAGTTTLVCKASDGTQARSTTTSSASCLRAAISGDGRFVSFQSDAPNLVPGDTNNLRDVFVHDLQTGSTTRVNVANDGTQANVSGGELAPAPLSFDGRYVVFRSESTLVAPGPPDGFGSGGIFVRDLQTGVTSRASLKSDGTPATGRLPEINADGRYVAFESDQPLVPGDTNGWTDVFVADREGDPPPPVVSVADVSVVERDSGTRTAVFTLSLSGISASTVSVNYATADGTAVAPGDYAASSGTVSFAPGTTTNTVGVPVNGDNAFEGNETFTLTLSAPQGATLGDATAVGTIVDDDPTISVGDAVVHEGTSSTRGAVFTVSLSKPSTSTVTVGYATTDATAVAGEDYTAKAGSLSFAPGVTTMAVKVPVLGDIVDESNTESFVLSLTSPGAAVIGDATGVGTIRDDDPNNVGGRRLAIGDVSVHEGDAGARTAVFNVSLSEPSSSKITVDFATVKGSATKAADFVGKTGKLSFAAGTTSLNLKVTINPDTTVEGDEAFTVVLSGLSGSGTFISDDTGLATIVDND